MLPVYRSVLVSSQLDSVGVEITVLLGRALIPMQQLLRMGRGAVIQLDTQEDDKVWVLANNHPIARGDLVVEGDRIFVTTGVVTGEKLRLEAHAYAPFAILPIYVALEKIDRWTKAFNKFQLEKYLLYATLLPKLASSDFRKWVRRYRIQPNLQVFQREVFEHYRIVFEKVKD